MIKAGRLEKQALSLGSANAVDYALQFLLPVVLARALDVESFGNYRLLWLAVGTVVVLTPLAMPQSLYYFLPRSDPAKKRLYINQTLVFMAVTSLLGALFLSPANPWQPESLLGMTEYGWLVPLFAFLWSIASLLDLLPTVEERVHWQSKVIVTLSGLRALGLSAAALATGRLGPVLWTLVAFVALKLVLLGWYIARHHGFGGPVMEGRAFKGQVGYAAPFGFSSALYGLRTQADQWVAAALFSIHQFAAFSVAAVIGPLIYICRQSVNHVFLPSMSRLEAGGNVKGMLALNSRANVMVAALVFPALAFAFLFARDIITLIYTASYVDAAPVMQVYVIGMACLVVELNSVMLVLREGPFTLRVNTLLLVISVLASWHFASVAGLAGAAAGSTIAVFLDRLLTVRRIARRTGIAIAVMQDWRSLATLMAISVFSALIAWSVVWRLAAYPTIVRLAVAGTVLGLVYLPLLFMLNSDGRLVVLRPKEASEEA
jgi:O-antigen/teichoic acid export membrane protein